MLKWNNEHFDSGHLKKKKIIYSIMEKYLCICQYLFVFVTLLNGEQEAVSVPSTNYGESIQTTLMPISTTSSEYDQNQINNTLGKYLHETIRFFKPSVSRLSNGCSFIPTPAGKFSDQYL